MVSVGGELKFLREFCTDKWEAVLNPENLADIISEWPLFARSCGIFLVRVLSSWNDRWGIFWVPWEPYHVRAIFSLADAWVEETIKGRRLYFRKCCRRVVMCVPFGSAHISRARRNMTDRWSDSIREKQHGFYRLGSFEIDFILLVLKLFQIQNLLNPFTTFSKLD